VVLFFVRAHGDGIHGDGVYAAGLAADGVKAAQVDGPEPFAPFLILGQSAAPVSSSDSISPFSRAS
jgi:hypothetical protein